MTHSQLVQAAVDLLSEVAQPQTWLDLFDDALANPSDRVLAELVYHMSASLHGRVSLAA